MLQLRRVLPPIVLVGLAACSNTVETLPQPTEHFEKTFTVSVPADPPLQFRIESCRVDVDACSELCQFVISRDGGTTGTLTKCQPTFTGDEVSIEAVWDVYPEMPVPDQAGTASRVPAHPDVLLARSHASLSTGGHS